MRSHADARTFPPAVDDDARASHFRNKKEFLVMHEGVLPARPPARSIQKDPSFHHTCSELKWKNEFLVCARETEGQCHRGTRVAQDSVLRHFVITRTQRSQVR